MRRCLPGLILCLAFSLAAPALAAPARGTVILEDSFNRADAASGWAGKAATTPAVSGSALLIANSATGATVIVTRKLAATDLGGCTVLGKAQIRATAVSAKPNPWNGVKFMLVIQGPGGTSYPQAEVGIGTFDWTTAKLTARIPDDTTNVTVMLGLEKVTGEVCFDEVKITVVKTPRVAPPAFAGPPVRGHDRARLRGAMISPFINEAGLRTLGGEWKANLVRWQFIRHHKPDQLAPLETYDAWLDDEIRRLDAALPVLRELGMLVALDLHSPPGGKGTTSGYVGSDASLFTDPGCQTKFVEVWRRLAARYKGDRTIWGFDLANEPVDDLVDEGCQDWQDLAERAGKAVREIDPERLLIIEPAQWGGAEGFREFYPLALTNVVYSFHMYQPHAFTHQGVHRPGPALVYPGEIQERRWDRAALVQSMRPALEFQRRYNVHLYVGEFSAIRWAPDNSAYRYLKDVISIFEEQGWDWSYHAFREWSGWSVEHGPDKENTKPTAEPGDRQKLLREWFGKNK